MPGASSSFFKNFVKVVVKQKGAASLAFSATHASFVPAYTLHTSSSVFALARADTKDFFIKKSTNTRIFKPKKSIRFYIIELLKPPKKELSHPFIQL